MEPNLQYDIFSAAEGFCDNFDNDGLFNYSFESVAAVERFLNSLNLDELDDDSLNMITTMAGGYIFEVARRNFGGTYYWIEEKNQPVLVTGEPDFAVSIYAAEKVKNRLSNGDEESLIDYFKRYIEAIKSCSETGDGVTVI